ncbi:membrane protein [Clostridium aceticum]|nr:membrane protein [Clostridium aceticum]
MFKTYNVYLLCINIVGMILMGVDKAKAKKNQWRIQELTFMIMALLGGAIGILIGMVTFHHKQSKKKFYIGIPLLYIINKVIQFITYHYLLNY